MKKIEKIKLRYNDFFTNKYHSEDVFTEAEFIEAINEVQEDYDSYCSEVESIDNDMGYLQELVVGDDPSWDWAIDPSARYTFEIIVYFNNGSEELIYNKFEE